MAATKFDAQQPQAFYLLDRRAELEALSDVSLVADGVRLPVHSQVLSVQSGVFCGLFAEMQGGAEARVGCKRKAEQEGPLVLEEPFADYSLQDAALFLRLAYHPEEKVASMDAMQKSLPGVLRLAHKLDAQPVFQTVRGYMTEHAHTITTPAVLDWAKAADSCQQDELRLCCLVETARRLARVPTSLAGAFADANRVVDALDKGMLAQLLGLMASAGGKKLCSRLAAPGAAAAALLEVGNHGSFDCVAARFSEASAEVGRSVESPWLAAAGREWKLQVCPGGATADASGHLSVFLHCKQEGTKANYSITVVDKAADEPQHKEQTSNEARLFPSDTGFGWPKFMSLQNLRARPGFLSGDRLMLRVRVEVLP